MDAQMLSTLLLLARVLLAAAAAPPDEAVSDVRKEAAAPGFFAGRQAVGVEPTGLLPIEGEPSRTWKNAFGGSVEARLVGLFAATIWLEGEADPVCFPLAWFGDEDREYVRAVLHSRGQAGLFPGVHDPEDEAAQLTRTRQEWERQLDRWSRTFVAAHRTGQDFQEVRQHLRNVRDPNALAPLAALVVRANPDALRTALVEAIAGIGGPEAVRQVVKLASTDRSGAVRASAVWALCQLKDPLPALDEFVKYLSVQQYRDPALLGLCAANLLRPTTSYDSPPVVTALIEILVVQERVPYVVWQISDTGWVPRGGSRWGRHISGKVETKWLRVPVPCELARRLLVEHSGRDYGYDRQAWQQWYKIPGP